MKMTIAAAALAATVGASALAANVTNLDINNLGTTGGWSAWGTAGNGSATISGARPRSGNGSLELRTGASGDKAAATFGSTRFQTGPFLGTLGQLAAGSISFDFLVDSSTTTAGFRAPALEFAVRSADGSQGVTLKWEAAYNGYPSNGPGVPIDSWVTVDATAGNFWMFRTGGAVEQFGVTLEDWVNGATFGGSPLLSADSVVVGMSIQAGSGWDNDFLGYADNINVSFFGGETYHANFELEGAVIPAPLAGLMGGAGLMLVGARRRR